MAFCFLESTTKEGCYVFFFEFVNDDLAEVKIIYNATRDHMENSKIGEHMENVNTKILFKILNTIANK